MTAPSVTLDDFPVKVSEKLRYRDLDRQGHVNNAVFATFLEAGRIGMLYDGKGALVDAGAAFVIVRLELDFIAEITWPGTVDVGTRVMRVGRSSFGLEQGIFQGETLAGFAVSTIVQTDFATRKSKPLSEKAVDSLNRMMAFAPGA
ncbi:acyl-CoA thioester hydrolase [Roseibium hamelinense]|uniref:Acyl-CoA thioester hydrolase n=1 Tax=Roseibium hamelinense TaxID=150831 RepID=A0A562THE9_9HYPH|nr:thioesterase family protein [Roseibium hamelinense]MTI45750.1 acyl-CoA thioesterase [Roseibium hamelinense]TWI93067.1 acyl-CoA thioester hydrolase [Roseibium hamelinense]